MSATGSGRSGDNKGVAGAMRPTCSSMAAIRSTKVSTVALNPANGLVVCLPESFMLISVSMTTKYAFVQVHG